MKQILLEYQKETIRQEFKPRFKELDDTFLPQIEQIVKEKGGKSSEAIAIRDQYNSARRTLLGQQTKAIAEAATKIRRGGTEFETPGGKKYTIVKYDPKKRPKALKIDDAADVKRSVQNQKSADSKRTER